MSSRDKLTERAQAQEPLVDPYVLNKLDQMDLPFRGEVRQNILKRVKEHVKRRRTVEGVSNRIASNISTPITEAVRGEVEDRTQRRVGDFIKNKVGNQGDNQ